MGRLFRAGGPVQRFLDGFADLVILNLLWLLCCLPVVTIGASTTAMYRLTLRRRREIDEGIPRAFFRAFRESFRQATAVGLLGLLAAGIIWLDARIIVRYAAAFGPLGAFIVYVPAVMGVAVSLYVFPLLALFADPPRKALKNALLMSLRHFGSTLMLLMNGFVPLGLAIVLGSTAHVLPYLWFVVGGAGSAWLNARVLLRVFENYVPEDQRSAWEEREI